MNKFGDGLATLLMFSLGLGCLNLVFHGLIDGTVSGSGSASFAFSTKPIKFILIELFWTGLASILWLGAWRGVFRKDAAEDDECNEMDKDESLERHPARPASASSRAHSTESSATRLPASSAGTSLQPKMATKASEPKILELYTSRFYAILAITFATLFMLSSLYTVAALFILLGVAFMQISMAIIVVIYIMTIAQCLRNFFWRGPVLVLDKFGIRNHRKGGHLIPWTEVDAVRIYADSASTYLVLRFRHASDVHAHFGKSRWLQSIFGRIIYKGFEGKVKLTSLVFTRSIVLRTAQDFLRYSRRLM